MKTKIFNIGGLNDFKIIRAYYGDAYDYEIGHHYKYIWEHYQGLVGLFSEHRGYADSVNECLSQAKQAVINAGLYVDDIVEEIK